MAGSARQAIRPGPFHGNRAVWRKLHLWLGLTLGLPMLIFGLTGSVLVFWQEIDAGLNPQLFEVEPSGRPVSLQASLDAATAAAPPGWEGIWLPVPAEGGHSLPFHFYYPEPRASVVGAESLNVFVDPGSGRVIGNRVFYHPTNPLRHSFVGFFFKLHYAFFLGATGVIVVGIIGALLLVSTMTGLVVWWPRGRKWSRAFRIKRRASKIRLTHDLHQVSGIYPFLILLAVLVSGLSFNLPDQFAWIVQRFSPITAAPTAQSFPRTHGLDRALEVARLRYPGGRLESLTVSLSPEDTVTACYSDVPELSHYIQDTRCLVLSGRTGELLRVQDARNGTGGDIFMSWQWPLHSGTILGWTGRILVFLTGLGCAILPITGCLRWLQKRKSAGNRVGKRTHDR